MLRDKIIAAVRTGSAVLGTAIVLAVVGKLTDWGFEVQVDPTWATVLSGALFALFVGAYNFVVAWAAENVWDGFGWLLGVNKPPAYVDKDLRIEPEDGGVAVDTDEPKIVVNDEARHRSYEEF
jgi:hypothetical protein